MADRINHLDSRRLYFLPGYAGSVLLVVEDTAPGAMPRLASLSTADALWLAAELVSLTGITPDRLARAVEEAS